MKEDTIKELETLMEALKEDHAKFEEGNNAAGTRVRKSCQEMKTKLQALRVDVQAQKNAK